MGEGTKSKLSEFLDVSATLDRIGANMPGLVYVYDLIGHRNLFANRPMAETLGYTAEQVQSMGARLLEMIIHPEDMPRVMVHHAGLSQVPDGTVVEIEYRVKSPDGSFRWLHSWESILARSTSGQPTQLFGIAQDVTARVQTEVDLLRSRLELEKSEQRWRSIVENPFDFVVVIDRDYKYTFVNFVAPGLELSDLIGKATPFDYVSPSDHEAMRTAFESVFNEGKSASYDVYVPSLDKWYASIVGPIKEGEHVTNASILTRDITTEKHSQAKARQAEQRLQAIELKLADSAKLEAVGQLAGGIAHDFNNLLTGIGGIAELLTRKLPPGDPDLQDLKDAVKRGAGLTRQLLTFSRRQPIEPTELDLNLVVENNARMLRRLIGDEIELTFEQAEKPLFVRSDRTQIEQIIINLALNARDAMPGGGQLKIVVAPIEISEDARRDNNDAHPGSYAQISVSDTGEGMTDAVIARIFEPFFTTKPIGSGTGLGLSLVYGIVQQNGGSIQVKSAPGKGSTFQIHLPACRPGLSTPTDHPSPPQGGNETILVVEDNDMALRVTRRLLETLGYKVCVAVRGDEAMALIEGGLPFDLLFTDIRLPAIDGHALYRAAAKLRPNLPVVFTSGYTAELLADDGIVDAGAVFLQKPFSHDELARKVRAALDLKLK
jgi:PAS domain S-box-containing protein